MRRNGEVAPKAVTVPVVKKPARVAGGTVPLKLGRCPHEPRLAATGATRSSIRGSSDETKTKHDRGEGADGGEKAYDCSAGREVVQRRSQQS